MQAIERNMCANEWHHRVESDIRCRVEWLKTGRYAVGILLRFHMFMMEQGIRTLKA